MHFIIEFSDVIVVIDVIELCQNKFISIMSGYFDGKVCSEFGLKQSAVQIKYIIR